MTQREVLRVDSTEAPGPLFATFQAVTSLLLAAASSSFQAGLGSAQGTGPAPAAGRDGDRGTARLVRPANRHHTPYLAVGLFALVTAGVVVAAGVYGQRLVLFYAVSVFLSFLAWLIAMAIFARGERRQAPLVLTIVGAVVVAFTLAVNLTRVDALASLGAALLISLGPYRLWVRAGRPGGIATVAADSGRTVEPDTP
jgi:hypothetical protein